MSDNPEIRRAVSDSEMPIAPPPPRASHAAQREHDVDSSEILLKMYVQKRIEGQLRFYDARMKEFEDNSSFLVWVGAVIMAISTVVSGLGVAGNSPFFAFMTALLPAIAALTASLRQLYQWDKQASLYRDAALGLQEARLILPDMDLFNRDESKTLFTELVKTTEDVFTNEINQWGQIALGLDESGKPAPDDPLNARLRTLAQGRITGSGGATFDDDGVG
jgi:SMODS and SLOG-associating 2TM effector domain 1